MVIAVVMVTGCGRIGFDASDGGAVVDGTPADACTFGPWSNPVALTEVNTSFSEYSPFLTDDGLEVFFSSERSGGLGNFDLYTATRATTGEPFGAPTALTQLNSSLMEDGAALTPDNLTLYFCVSAGTTTDPCALMRATRPSRSSAFGAPQPIAELTDAWGPYPSRDGHELIYSTDAGALGHATFSSGALIDAGPLAELNTMQVGFATLSADGLTIYYEAHPVSGTAEIFSAQRPAVGMPFTGAAPVDLGGGGAGTYDGDPNLSNGDRTLSFSSIRGGTVDLYVATRACQ